MHCVGLDIGGANLKFSDGQQSFSIPFALWERSAELADALLSGLTAFPSECALAVTMTGELADCYATRREGVSSILNAVQSISAQRSVGVWSTSGEFLTITQSLEFPILVAAANWHALATWAGRLQPRGNLLLIDMGSTTTDIIPVENGLPMPQGRTDLERLASGELLYMGLRRTPVCSIVESLELPMLDAEAVRVPIAREFFATVADAMLILGRVQPDPSDHSTANGQPFTHEHAQCRLSRMLCSDTDDLSDSQITIMAQDIERAMQQCLRDAFAKATREFAVESVLLSGEGETFVRKTIPLPTPNVFSLGDMLGPEHSTAACAYALAELGRERL